MRIHSPVESIRNLVINPWRAGMGKSVDIVAYINGYSSIMMCRGTNGKVYMKGAKNSKRPVGPLNEYYIAVVETLEELNVVPKEDIYKHLCAVKEVAERRQRGWDANSMIERAKYLGIKITVHQMKKLSALMMMGNVAECQAQPGSRYHPGGELIVWEVE